ncbi:MAG: MarR family transcriptional regulator [Burkholderiales bacterium]|nr:MarR family transcriptional regulator [Burkholderiales bacterium]
MSVAGRVAAALADRPVEAGAPTEVATPPKLSLGALADVLGYHIAQAAVTTVDMFERHVGARFSLRKVEFSILMLLLANGPLSPKRLGQVLVLTAPNLTLLLDRLQERGLLRRERNQEDRRSQNIVLTETGLRTAREAAAAAGPMERELAGRLSAAERAMLLELLRKVAGR